MTSHWDNYEKDEFKLARAGQITLHTEAGKQLYTLLKQKAGIDIHTIVEIGTWNGRGSTLCIIEGIQGKSITSFHSLECNQDKYLSAIDYLDAYLEDTIHILWGSIVSRAYIECKEYRANFPDLDKSEQLKSWFNIDILNCDDAPNVLDALPETIDFLLLDGGEYTTLSEFEILLPRCHKYIAMDDIYQDKCRECRRRLLDDIHWKEIFTTEERNGFSIFMYIT
jgi:hypothetical protein